MGIENVFFFGGDLDDVDKNFEFDLNNSSCEMIRSLGELTINKINEIGKKFQLYWNGKLVSCLLIWIMKVYQKP